MSALFSDNCERKGSRRSHAWIASVEHSCLLESARQPYQAQRGNEPGRPPSADLDVRYSAVLLPVPSACNSVRSKLQRDVRIMKPNSQSLVVPLLHPPTWLIIDLIDKVVVAQHLCTLGTSRAAPARRTPGILPVFCITLFRARGTTRTPPQPAGWCGCRFALSHFGGGGHCIARSSGMGAFLDGRV